MPSRQRQTAWYTQNNAHGAASKFGQLIGDAFANAVYDAIDKFLQVRHPDYALLTPDEGRQTVRLETFGGTSRQLDNVIAPKGSRTPVALFESKWLKDARHHNDKGAWILQLKEIRRKYPTVRGAVAHLAGYWTDSVGVMFESEGRVKMVLVATDSEIYASLQPHLDAFVAKHRLESLFLDPSIVRLSLPRAWDAANCLQELRDAGTLHQLASTWLEFERTKTETGIPVLGKHLIWQAIDELLAPLPINPAVTKFEIALEISTGNMIYAEFHDLEEAIEFLQTYANDPRAILRRISPQPPPLSE